MNKEDLNAYEECDNCLCLVDNYYTLEELSDLDHKYKIRFYACIPCMENFGTNLYKESRLVAIQKKVE